MVREFFLATLLFNLESKTTLLVAVHFHQPRLPFPTYFSSQFKLVQSISESSVQSARRFNLTTVIDTNVAASPFCLERCAPSTNGFGNDLSSGYCREKISLLLFHLIHSQNKKLSFKTIAVFFFLFQVSMCTYLLQSAWN